MTKLERAKQEIIHSLETFCVRCKEGIEHQCPVRRIAREIEAIRGVPVIVNDQLRHVVFS